jgi:hypothetical protein
VDTLKLLYPEIALMGDYATFLRSEILRSSHPARDRVGQATDRTATYYANTKQGDRSVNTTVAAEERLFIANFWDKGVQVGSLSSPDLSTVTGAILTFLADRMAASTMTNAFSEFSPTPEARPHEVGAMDEVAFQWDAVKRTLEAEAPELLSLANTLSRTWPFSHLFPTVSLEALYFSRCTGTPYSGDCPSVVWLSPGHYEVRTRGGNEPVGGGDEATALNLLQAALPPGCGPAVQGSAETLS